MSASKKVSRHFACAERVYTRQYRVYCQGCLDDHPSSMGRLGRRTVCQGDRASRQAIDLPNSLRQYAEEAFDRYLTTTQIALRAMPARPSRQHCSPSRSRGGDLWRCLLITTSVAAYMRIIGAFKRFVPNLQGRKAHRARSHYGHRASRASRQAVLIRNRSTASSDLHRLWP